MIDLQADHTKVFGGIFDGNKDNQTYKSIAVYIGADDCVVDGIHSIDSKGYGIKGVSVANSDVRNNYIENCDYIGIYFSMTGAAADIDGPRIFNNIVDRRDSTTAEGGIKIHSGTYYYNNVLISGNKVMLGVAGVECIELRAKYSSIVGNYVEGVVTSGIGVTTGSSNVSVTGNTVSCEDTTSYGIELSASTSDIVVNGNCINGAERGIATTGAVDSMERFTISSNTIKGFDTDGIWVRYVDGVTIGDNTIDATAGGRPILISLTTGSVAISGNTLIADLEVDQKGITLDNASSVAITGNTFFGCYRGVKLQSSEVYEFTGIAIVGNDFSNCTDPIIEDVPSGSFSDIKVYGNTGLEDFIDWVNGVEIKTYDGDPTGWLTTSIGSLIIDYTNGDLYISTDGTSTGLREITREAD